MLQVACFRARGWILIWTSCDLGFRLHFWLMYTEIQFHWFLLVVSVCWFNELHQDPSSGLHMAWKCTPGKILLLLTSSRIPCLGFSLAAFLLHENYSGGLGNMNT